MNEVRLPRQGWERCLIPFGNSQTREGSREIKFNDKVIKVAWIASINLNFYWCPPGSHTKRMIHEQN